MNKQRGFVLVEALVALTIVGVMSVVLLGGIATSSKATIVTGEQEIAESLVRTEIEYVKNHSYLSYPSTYPLDPNMTIPSAWTIPLPSTSKVHATDDGIQIVTVSAVHQGRTILTIQSFKVNR
jgi:prepilin-type N-terminal cleavage/methylation domain-containing protein